MPIKGEEGVFVLRKLCVLMCLSKGRRGVRTDVSIKGEEGVVRTEEVVCTDVPIKGEEGCSY